MRFPSVSPAQKELVVERKPTRAELIERIRQMGTPFPPTSSSIVKKPMPAGERPFFDTNVVAYAFNTGDRRQKIALDLLLRGGTVGVQTLNEFVSVVISKLKRPLSDAINWLETINALCPDPVPLTIAVHRRGLQIAQSHGYHIYDSLMLPAALEASCTIFYSEDLHHGQQLADLTIRNPFA